MEDVWKGVQLRNTGYGVVAKEVVIDAVSARSAANHLYLFRCAAVSARKAKV